MIVMLQVILYTIVDVGNFGDVEAFVFRAEIFFDLSPATSHQFPRFTMIKYRVLRLRIFLLNSYNIQKLLNENVNMLATSDWILD